MKKLFIIALVMLALTGCTGNKAAQKENTSAINTKNTNETAMINTDTQTKTAIIHTTMGDITVELFVGKMPITAGNFIKLAEEGFYNEVKFHRVIKEFMIQGGDPLTKDETKQSLWGTGGPGYAIEDEHVKGFSNTRGTLSMANSGPNSGGSQFFINLVDNTQLDFDKNPLSSKHPVFGKVVDGMDVVDTIGSTPTGPGDRPIEPVIITSVEVK